MAINFPPPPLADGHEYTDANSGTWVYDSGTNSWTLVAGGNTSAFNFRGGHDFRSSTPPADPIESGDMWIHDAPDGTIDGVYTGISGQIANGQLVLWDGNSYVMVSGTLPGYPDVGDGEGGTLDSRYLKLGANAPAQTVATTQTTTFNGTVESGGGVKVTGGNTGIGDGMVKYANGSLGLVWNGEDALRFSNEAGREGYIGFYTNQPSSPLSFRLTDFDDAVAVYCDFTPTHNGSSAESVNIRSSVDSSGWIRNYNCKNFRSSFWHCFWHNRHFDRF